MSKVFDLERFKSTEPPKPTAHKARKRTGEPFAQVPLKWIEQAAQLTRSPTTLVLVELLYASWKVGGASFTLPTARLKQLGVGKNVIRKALLDLECGRMIAVQRLPRKATMITLLKTPQEGPG